MALVIHPPNQCGHQRIISPSVPCVLEYNHDPDSKTNEPQISVDNSTERPDNAMPHTTAVHSAPPTIVKTYQNPLLIRQISPQQSAVSNGPKITRRASAVLSSASFAKPPCCRKLIHQFEKELTFHPRLNTATRRLVSRNPQCQLPVVTRLADSNRTLKPYYDDSFTFSPKLNPLSVKLAQERAAKLQEMQEKGMIVAGAKMFEERYTFRPNLSKKSQKIAETLDIDFHTRQQQHIERRQKKVS